MRENGFFYVRVQRNHETIRFSTKTRDRELALEIYRDFLRELALQRIPGEVRRTSDGAEIVVPASPAAAPPPPDADFRKSFDEYLGTCRAKGYAEKTLRMKSYLLNRLAAVGVSSLADISQESVNQFVQNLTGSSDYKQEAVKQLKAFMNFCIRRGFFSRELYARLEFPRFQKMKRETVVSQDDFRKIVDHLAEKGDRDFAFYLRTLYETVTRPSEAAALQVEDFDFGSKTVSVLMGKTKQRKRAFLRDSYLDDLRKYLDANGIRSGRIFAGFGRSPEFYANKFAKVRDRLGLNKKYNLYAFRHTAITDLVNSTSDIEFAAKQAGNSPELALKHYLHRSDRHYQELIKKAENPDK